MANPTPYPNGIRTLSLLPFEYTESERDLIPVSDATNGLLIFVTDGETPGFQYYDHPSTSWIPVGEPSQLKRITLPGDPNTYYWILRGNNASEELGAAFAINLTRIEDTNYSGATGQNAFSAGLDNDAGGFGSVVFGARNISGSQFSFTAGSDNNTGAPGSTVFGFSNLVQGGSGRANMFVTGVSNDVSGNTAFVAGRNNIVTGDLSFVVGENNTDVDGGRFIAGNNNEGSTPNETIFGTYSEKGPTVAEDDPLGFLFRLGNGYYDFTTDEIVRSNALIINRAGLAELPSVTNDMIDAASDKAVVTKEWVEANAGGGATNLGYTPSATDGTVTSDTGTDATIPAGSTTNASLMLPGDKTKLDAITVANIGNVVGPATSTDNAIARFDLATGKVIQDSSVLVTDVGEIIYPQVATPAYARGKLAYDTTNECLTFFNDDSSVAVQIGQEEWIKVRNTTGSTIPNGSAVYFNGSSSGFPTIALAQANSGTTTVCAGITTESIANNATGYVTSLGLVRNLNTSSFAVGAVYLSATTPGGLTQTVPLSPNYRYRVGFVTAINATTGTIHVTPSTAALGNGTPGQIPRISAGGMQEYFTPTYITEAQAKLNYDLINDSTRYVAANSVGEQILVAIPIAANTIQNKSYKLEMMFSKTGNNAGVSYKAYLSTVASLVGGTREQIALYNAAQGVLHVEPMSRTLSIRGGNNIYLFSPTTSAITAVNSTNAGANITTLTTSVMLYLIVTAALNNLGDSTALESVTFK